MQAVAGASGLASPGGPPGPAKLRRLDLSVGGEDPWSGLCSQKPTQAAGGGMEGKLEEDQVSGQCGS